MTAVVRGRLAGRVSVGWWWLGVVLCLGALVLVRGSALEYRRQWIASGRSARSWYLQLGRRYVILLLVFGAYWLVMTSAAGVRVAHRLVELLERLLN